MRRFSSSFPSLRSHGGLLASPGELELQPVILMGREEATYAAGAVGDGREEVTRLLFVPLGAPLPLAGGRVLGHGEHSEGVLGVVPADDAGLLASASEIDPPVRAGEGAGRGLLAGGGFGPRRFRDALLDPVICREGNGSGNFLYKHIIIIIIFLGSTYISNFHL